jgi:serine protease inhibitor
MKLIRIFIFGILVFTHISYASSNVQNNEFVNSINKFGFDLYKALNETNLGQNQVLSPYSLSSVLVLLTEGAAGETLQQLKTMLHLQSIKSNILTDQDRVSNSLTGITEKSCRQWSCFIDSIKQFIKHQRQKQSLVIANALWLQNNLHYQASFQKSIHESPFVHFYQVDFAKNPEQAREDMNTWIKNKTFNEIQELFAQGTITRMTRFVVANGIYFKGQWQKPFKKEDTTQKPFKLHNGEEINVPMMQQHDKFNYTESNLLQLILLPYGQSQLVMAIILPKPGNDLQNVIKTFDLASFQHLMSTANLVDVELILPKFRIESTFANLAKPLQALGLRDAFNEKANFSRMVSEQVQISDIIQKAMITVDEEGTTAAAATGAIMMVTALPTQPKVFNANHPYLFVIFDQSSHIILFMGQVYDPRTRNH